MMEKVFLTINGDDEQTFLKKHKHTDIESVTEIGLDWTELVGIHDYYSSLVVNKLEIAAQEQFLELKNLNGVHTVKYRIKNPSHLVDKIIRKKKEQGRVITKDNFMDEIDDLIGFRIMHLFKTDWESIYSQIKEKYESKETPVAYHRVGDDKHFIERCKELGLETKEKEGGYRSVHYIARFPFLNTQLKCEIQIRTLFEEAWSEIDHRVRYPNNTDNELLNNYLLMLNKLAGCADDMGAFLMAMKRNLEQHQDKQNELESVVGELRSEISKLKGLKKSQDKKIKELMNRLDKSVELGWPYLSGFPSTLDILDNYYIPGGLMLDTPLSKIQEGMNKMHGAFDSIEKLKKLTNSENPAFQMPKIDPELPTHWSELFKDAPERKKPEDKKE